ncbi:MAG: ribbon-helix-helix domain-containing protein [Gemmatimonadota bacterium]|nr:ribbon-helix-helix domain-containing protein [Gemmatimonadota bacterium]
MKTIKTTVYLNAADYRRLKLRAADEGRSAAELVREAVAEYAARIEPHLRPKCVGIANSGDPQFAERSEELLDDFGEEDLAEDPGVGPFRRLPAAARRRGIPE